MKKTSLYFWKLLAIAGLMAFGRIAMAQQYIATGASVQRASSNGEIPPETLQALFRVPMYPQTSQSTNLWPPAVQQAAYGNADSPTPAKPKAGETAHEAPAPVKVDGWPTESQPATKSLTSLKSYQIEQAAPPKEVVAAPTDPTKESSTSIPPADGFLLDGVCCPYNHCGWSWIFGLEETFLVPNTQGLSADVTVVSPTNSFNAVGSDRMEFGPRVWFGAQYCNWQVRTRFWTINGVNDRVDPLVVGGTDRLGTVNNSYVDALTVDVEALRLFCCAEDWNLYGGIGFRYGSLHDVASFAVTQIDNQAIPAVVQANAMSLINMEGTGITIPVGGFKPIHCFCCSTLDAFWNFRSSILWGAVDNVAQTSVTVIDPNAAGTANRFDTAAAHTSNEMFICELQAGLRWRHELRCAPACAAMWIAFEYQWWNADGGVALTNSAAAVNNNGGLAQASSGPDVELSLIGFTLGASLNW